MKIFILLPLDGRKPDVKSRDPVEYHLEHLITGLKDMGHKISLGMVPDRRHYDVALSVDYSPYLKLVRAEKHFTDLYSADRTVPELDGVFFRSYHHQYLIRRVSNIELEKCFIVGQVFPDKRGADRWASDTPYLYWPVDPTWGLYHILRLWPQIRERVSEVTLLLPEHPYVALAKFKLDANIRGIHSAYSFRWAEELAKETHIRNTKKILPGSNTVFAYTYDPVQPSDMFGSSVGTALSAGIPTIVPGGTALGEVWGKRGALVLPYPPLDIQNSFEDNLWLSAIEEAFESPAPEPQGLDDYNWYNVASRYVQAFEGNEVEFGRPGVTLIGNANSDTA